MESRILKWFPHISGETWWDHMCEERMRPQQVADLWANCGSALDALDDLIMRWSWLPCGKPKKSSQLGFMTIFVMIQWCFMNFEKWAPHFSARFQPGCASWTSHSTERRILAERLGVWHLQCGILGVHGTILIYCVLPMEFSWDYGILMGYFHVILVGYLLWWDVYDLLWPTASFQVWHEFEICPNPSEAFGIPWPFKETSHDQQRPEQSWALPHSHDVSSVDLHKVELPSILHFTLSSGWSIRLPSSWIMLIPNVKIYKR